MTEDISDKFRELKENFQLVAKRILKSELTQNRDKHREYIRDLITGYNNIASLVEPHADSFDEDSKKYFIGEWRYIRDKIRKAFTRLGIETTLPSGILAHICVNEILSIYNSNCFRNQAYEEFFGAFENFSPEIVYRDRTRKSKRVIMGEDEDKKKAKKEFVRTASQQINYTYSGDPLKLDSFVNSINLLRELTEKEHEMTLVTFVISRLEGKALQCVPAGCNNIDKLIEALKKRLKPIHSKVIMGKLMALRPDRSRLTDFADEAEKLAESLERSLVFEGIPQHKSHEMTIQKSLELCLSVAKSDFLRSVLTTTDYDTPGEVLSNYVVQSKADNDHRQVLAYKTSRNQNSRHNNNRGQRYNGYYNTRGGHGSNNNSNNGSYRNGNRNFNRYSRNDNNGQTNSNYNSNNSNSNSSRPNSSHRNKYNSNNNSNRNVRYSENFQDPQTQLGAAQN